jgi:putative ABC transport system permease protein
MIWENLKMALTSLRTAKLRSFLTMLGIIIGIASVVSINAVGEGVKKAISNQVAEFGTDLLQVNPGRSFDDSAPEGDQSGGGGGFNPAASFGSSTLTEADVEIIRQAPDVKTVAPFMVISGVVRNGDKEAPGAFVMATTAGGAEIFPQKISRGRFFNDSETDVVVLGGTVAETLFGKRNPIDRSVSLRGKDYKVVGVQAKPSQGGLSFGPGTGNAVFLPFAAGKALSNNTANIIEIDVRADSPEKVATLKTELKKRLLEAHGGERDFTVATPQEQLKLFDNILNMLTGFIAAIASIALLVGGIGIMNIMLVSVTERTREIGIRKALGATRAQILTQFLIEAIVISLLGGLLGILAAIGQGTLVAKLAKLTPVFKPEAFTLAIGVSVLVGVIFGIAPAIRASRKRPIEALRYE